MADLTLSISTVRDLEKLIDRLAGQLNERIDEYGEMIAIRLDEIRLQLKENNK